MSSRRIASGNPTLTNYAQGLTQDLARALANFLAPKVIVPATIGQYKSYNQKQDFQVYETGRGIGGKANRIHFEATDPTYNCKPQALEIPLDDAERDAEGNFSLDIQRAKTRTLVSAATISHEDKVITKAKTLAATANVGAWGNADKDPVAEIDAQIRAITIETGRMPNRIAFGLLAWERFRNHDKVKARQADIEVKGLTTLQAARMFLNPAVEIMVGVLSKDSNKMGEAANKVNIIGDDVFIFYAEPNPTEYDASFMKTFQGGEGGVDAVRVYRDESCRSDVLAVDWAVDIQVTSTICGKRITTTG